MDFQGYTIFRVVSVVDDSFLFEVDAPSTDNERMMFVNFAEDKILDNLEEADASDEVASGDFLLQGRKSSNAKWVTLETLGGFELNPICKVCGIALADGEYDVCEHCADEDLPASSSEVYRRALSHFNNTELAREAAELYPGDFI